MNVVARARFTERIDALLKKHGTPPKLGTVQYVHQVSDRRDFGDTVKIKADRIETNQTATEPLQSNMYSAKKNLHKVGSSPRRRNTFADDRTLQDSRPAPNHDARSTEDREITDVQVSIHDVEYAMSIPYSPYR